MSLIFIVSTLMVTGVTVCLVNACLPINRKTKIGLNAAVAICVVIWLWFALRVIHPANDGFQKQSNKLQLLT
jgi:hypothetical protein